MGCCHAGYLQMSGPMFRLPGLNKDRQSIQLHTEDACFNFGKYVS